MDLRAAHWRIRSDKLGEVESALTQTAERLWTEGFDLIELGNRFDGPQILTAFGPVSVSMLAQCYEQGVRMLARKDKRAA